MGYVDRLDAGRRLAKALRPYRGKDTVILALPRGGVVLGAEVAKELRAPLALVLVRKIGHPQHSEYAIGAVAENSDPIYNKNEVALIDRQWLKQAEAAARKLISLRHRVYYDDELSPPDVKGKTVILVDDGIATGFTMEAAVRAMRKEHAKRIIVAVPVASSESIDILENIADETVVLDNPANFMGAVGGHYLEFEQVDDEEVAKLLREVNQYVQGKASRDG